MTHDHDTTRMQFREDLVIEGGDRLGDVMDPWQRADFEALDDPAHRHAYLERSRGHSKTGDVATEAVVELFLGGPERELFCVAVDEDQAAILFRDVVGKIRRRPDLNAKVAIGKSEITVKATRSTLTVLSSDAPSAFGLRPSWLALDEMAERRKRDLWDALWSATGKKADCRVLFISTAGWDRTSIAWEVRTIAESEADWLFSSRGQCASWVSPAWLEQQKRTLPPHVFARLHENKWVDGVGAFLTGAEVDGVFVEDVPEGIGPRAIGLDLGLSKDRSVLSIVRRDTSGLVVIEGLTTWAGQHGEKVDLTVVEEEVAAMAAKVKAPVVVDPWQAVLLAQRLRARGLPVIEFAFTGDGRRKIFGTMLDLIATAAFDRARTRNSGGNCSGLRSRRPRADGGSITGLGGMMTTWSASPWPLSGSPPRCRPAGARGTPRSTNDGPRSRRGRDRAAQGEDARAGRPAGSKSTRSRRRCHGSAWRDISKSDSSKTRCAAECSGRG